jgi:hypothetical protein
MMDMTPSKFGGEGGMRVEEEFFSLCFNDKKLFFEIEHPTPEDMETYDWYKLTSPYPFLNETRRNKKKVIETYISICEWRKRYWLRHSISCLQKQKLDKIQGDI